jgi:hypothetical protein
MKGFFKVLAVKELRTFGIILARMIPAQAHLMTSNVPTYLTEEQMRAELREAGLPEDIVKFMRPVDARLIDPDELDENPYEDPEAEGDGDVIDVTPNDTGK